MAEIESNLVALFASNLRRLREDLNLSQEEVAHRSGLDRTYISGCERGVRNPTLATVEKISSALGVQPDHLLRGPQ
ncbi:MAG: hypothetical protein B7Y35_00310 [Sphingomonadales bacterium 28-64-96]|nr:MAG: hypothetical protein B7Y35_00310 [Sphingomonadales bacterium 28-64-96]